MLFNSLDFLVFLPITLIVFFAGQERLRLWVCLAASYVFYSWWDWRFLSLLLCITAANYFAGLYLAYEERSAKRKLLLMCCCIFNIGLLGVFKYFHFFEKSLNKLASLVGVGLESVTFQIILPVGISFFTFQAMSYTIDVYFRRMDVEYSFLRFANFVAFFPQLVAGPIIRASVFLPQLRERHSFHWDRFISGFYVVLWGYFLKVVVADSLALVVDSRFANPAIHTSLSLMIGVFFYAFQIYADFCGYSSIAIGLARIMGFDFGLNFDRPYFAASFSEFWKRWHISLSSWMRDYVYIPMGGNRQGNVKTLRNLMVTMLMGGLWHGAAWCFIAWGGLHGAYLIFEGLLKGPYNTLIRALRVPALLSKGFLIGLVFLLTSFAWVFFRAQTFDAAFHIMKRIAALDNMSFSAIIEKFHVVKGALLIMVVWLLELMSFRVSPMQLFKSYPVLGVATAAVCLWLMALFGTYSENAFIYFQF